jgi:3',5'-cyclic AMP phosphodiesterase CpdA
MKRADVPDPCGGLMQISDPHFGTERAGAVDALVALVTRRQPALVVLSGDITQRATVAQFAAARAFVDRLGPVPVVAVPGNHDLPLWAWWTRWRRPYGRYEAAFGPAGDVERAVGAWHVLALNTTRPWRHKHGEVSARQVADTAARLRAAAPSAIKVVVTHQPVAVALVTEQGNRLRGADAAIPAWQAAGGDLVLGGHIHLTGVLRLRGGVRPLWAVQAGTAVSSRVRHDQLNSVTELLAWPTAADGTRRVAVRFWDWTIGAPAFAAREDIVLPLAPA